MELARGALDDSEVLRGRKKQQADCEPIPRRKRSIEGRRQFQASSFSRSVMTGTLQTSLGVDRSVNERNMEANIA